MISLHCITTHLHTIGSIDSRLPWSFPKTLAVLATKSRKKNAHGVLAISRRPPNVWHEWHKAMYYVLQVLIRPQNSVLRLSISWNCLQCITRCNTLSTLEQANTIDAKKARRYVSSVTRPLSSEMRLQKVFTTQLQKFSLWGSFNDTTFCWLPNLQDRYRGISYVFWGLNLCMYVLHKDS